MVVGSVSGMRRRDSRRPSDEARTGLCAGGGPIPKPLNPGAGATRTGRCQRFVPATRTKSLIHEGTAARSRRRESPSVPGRPNSVGGSGRAAIGIVDGCFRARNGGWRRCGAGIIPAAEFFDRGHRFFSCPPAPGANPPVCLARRTSGGPPWRPRHESEARAVGIRLATGPAEGEHRQQPGRDHRLAVRPSVASPSPMATGPSDCPVKKEKACSDTALPAELLRQLRRAHLDEVVDHVEGAAEQHPEAPPPTAPGPGRSRSAPARPPPRRCAPPPPAPSAPAAVAPAAHRAARPRRSRGDRQPRFPPCRRCRVRSSAAR